jgi:hypothetical protein
MKKIPVIILIICASHLVASSQPVKLSGVYDRNNSAVKLNWNMVNSNSRTSYLLLRSADGVTWMEAAKDRMLRYYSEDDIYFFNDRYFQQGKNYYRLKITDAGNNTVALSPVIIVNTNSGVTVSNYESQTGKQSTVPKIRTETPAGNSWVIYPNPATDLLKLMYKGQGEIKGVVNVQIQDATGKIVVKFRSGSMYKNIQIPISNLQRGTYFIQLTVANEVMLKQAFVKQ